MRRSAVTLAAICARKSPSGRSRVSRARYAGDEHAIYVGFQPMPLCNLHDRQDEAFLVDLGAGCQAARLCAANINVVRQIGGVGDQLLAMEDRRDDDDDVSLR